MAVGLIAGGWLASAVISKLIAEIVELAKNHKKKLGLKGVLARLDEGLPKIGAVLNDVDQGKIREINKDLEKWLWKLRDAADQAEDVMDEIKYRLVKENAEPENKVSVVKVFLERVLKGDPILKKLKKTVELIDNVVSDIGNFNKIVCDLVEKQKEAVNLANSNRQTGSLVNANTVYGREKEKEEIINKLLNPKCETKGVNFAVLPIIGQGGIGKTTLAQAVYNDPIVQKHFKLKMWVHISNKFDKVFLVKKLYQSVFQKNADVDEYSLIERMVYDKLQSQRFLVVFDDAWNDNDKAGWDSLITPLKSGSSGSMILLTTRMKTIAPLIKYNLMESVYLGQLEEHNIWNLLKERVFGDKDARCDKQLEILGRQITKKLKGSPLAAKAVGGMLSSKLDDQFWRSISESELWCLDQNPDGIMPALRLTYEHLPPQLKPCFSFCSIFPQDHIFIKDDLINMWVALGLMPPHFNGTKIPEDVGSEYFEDMLNRSIFTPASPVRNAHFHYPAYTYCSITEKQFVGGYIMHDLMHDLSSFVSQGECFRSDRNKSVTIPRTVRHLYTHVGDCSELSNLELKNVRTLILQFDDYNPTELVCVLNELLKGMTSLRLLTLFSLKLSEIPESIGDLLHLRYLSISSFMLGEFPSSMSRLHYLETVVCGGFGSTNQANVLVKLKNLRRIIASESFVHLITGIGRLTSLQELCFHVDKKSGVIMSELSNMRELRRLTISNINDVSNHEEAKQANLTEKQCLHELSLQWETDLFDEDVLDHLEPHSGLRKLRIRNYMGRKPPIWLRTQTLSKLEVLSLESIRSMEAWSLTEQSNKWMQCLKELTIFDCNMLHALPPLPVSLKKLKLERSGLILLPNLWEDQTRSGSCPSLVKIEIRGCQNLTSLDEGLLNKPDIFVALEEVIITECSELRIQPGAFNIFSSLKRLEITECPRTDLFDVLVSLPHSKLQFLNIDNYIEDAKAKSNLRNEPNHPILRLRDTLTLHLQDTPTLFVFDHPRQSNLESRFLRMKDYIGEWPPTWLAQSPTPLKSLCISGSQHFRDVGYDTSDEYKDKVEALLHLIYQYKRTEMDDFPTIRAPPSLFEQAFVATHRSEWIQRLKKVKVVLWSASCVMPLPLTLKELKLHALGMDVIPNLFGNQTIVPGIFPHLVTLEIKDFTKIESLAEGMLQKPEQFPALKEITIWYCTKLMILPQGGFNKFFSLKKLDIRTCRRIKSQFVEECFIPSALRRLTIASFGDLDSTLSKALENVRSLSSLTLIGCKNISSLPPREVFSRWETLEKLEFVSCNKLTSLESLLGLSYVRLLNIHYCPKLVSEITSPSVGRKDEIEEDGTIQTSNRPASTQPTPADPSSSTHTEQKPLLSMDELRIGDPQLLSIEPIRSLSSLRKLTIGDCSRMQLLPELLPTLQELSLHECSSQLISRCQQSGEDWPKLSHIRKVYLSRQSYTPSYASD